MTKQGQEMAKNLMESIKVITHDYIKALPTDRERLFKAVNDTNLPIMGAMVDTKVFLKAIEINKSFKAWKADALAEIEKL